MAIFRKDDTPMIDRYRWWEIALIYCGIFAFLFFLLSPFIEGFLVSLKPLSQLFSTPYSFWPENGSFAAYSTMWERVPGFARYIFNSFFISIIVTAIVLVLVVPEARRIGVGLAHDAIRTGTSCRPADPACRRASVWTSFRS